MCGLAMEYVILSAIIEQQDTPQAGWKPAWGACSIMLCRCLVEVI